MDDDRKFIKVGRTHLFPLDIPKNKGLFGVTSVDMHLLQSFTIKSLYRVTFIEDLRNSLELGAPRAATAQHGVMTQKWVTQNYISVSQEFQLIGHLQNSCRN